MKVFIDDERMPLKSEAGEWVIVRDPRTACLLIQYNAAVITHISFDNDLGHAMEGRHILEQFMGNPHIRPLALPRLEEIRIHSANVVANKAMIDLAISAQKSGIIRPDVTIVSMSALNQQYMPMSCHYDEAMEDEEERLAAL